MGVIIEVIGSGDGWVGNNGVVEFLVELAHDSVYGTAEWTAFEK